MLSMPFVGACRAAPNVYRSSRCSNQFIPGSLSSYGHSMRVRGRKCEIEWTRLTFCKIVTSHMLAASLGLILLVLGSLYSKEAYYNKRTSVPLLLCILANVTGLILLSGSIALSKVTYAKLKQQRLASANASANPDSYCGESLPLGPPPPYTAYGDPSGPYRDDPRQIYVDINIHPQTATTNIMISPPEYTCDLPDYSDPPPPYRSMESMNPIYQDVYESRRVDDALELAFDPDRCNRLARERNELDSIRAQVHRHRCRRHQCAHESCHRLLNTVRHITVRCNETSRVENADCSRSNSSLGSECSCCSENFRRGRRSTGSVSLVSERLARNYES